jgi:hypothetical protein
MQVTILLDVSDHARSYVAGEICDLSDEHAARWIAAGYAAAVLAEPEAAALAEPPERATMPASRKRGSTT